MTEFNLDLVAGELNSLGISAEVDQTGGGTATLFAGERFFDRNGDPRWMVIGGPGWFVSPTYLTGATADTSEFTVGADNDGDDGSDVVDFLEFVNDSTETIVKAVTIVIAFRVRNFTWPDGAYQRADGHWGDHDVLADERRRQHVAGQLEKVV